ncbi:MAG: VWA domain-containing protein [Planctomycetota bacterium]|jgi:uncharacterized membrane protein
MNLHFLHPEAILLGVLVLFVLRRRFVWGRGVTVLRTLLLLALVGLLAEPWMAGSAAGRDLILVIDRSRSVPADATARVPELAERAAEALQPGDRIGVVLFGKAPVVETAPTEDYRYAPPAKEVDADGSDLAAAIEAGVALIGPDRAGSLLLVSDGEITGRDPAPAARHALRRGIRVDAVPLRRTGVFDLAVEELALPGEVALDEPFQFSVWIRSDREVEAPVRLLRDGTVIAEGRRSFRPGLNRLRMRDRLGEQGVHLYDVQIGVDDDRVAENNHARAAVRVTGPFHVLAVTPNGRQDRLTRSLEAAGIALTVTAPPDAVTDLDALDGFRAVILEDVPLQDLPRGASRHLATYVRDLGGGLLMTGGRASFGPGGYHKSDVGEVLPISMELREEQRRFSLAMAIALDRSGSMSMSAGRGRTKMDLANLGACAAVELLTALDSVAVIAVDSSPHVVVPLTSAEDRSGIMRRIRRIESMGGGIFTSTALHAAAGQLARASQGAKHIVLFADAADAEEPGDYETFVPRLRQAGVTVSVIGLGSAGDSDAAFLRDVATRGGGRAFFVGNAADLPRVFAQETIQVAKSSIVEDPTDVDVLPDLLALGAYEGAFPRIGGYSIGYRRPGAQVGLLTTDDQKAPLLAFWQHGLGRSAAYLGIADGRLSGDLSTWTHYADFFATLVRWVAGSEASADVFAEMVRRGHEGVLTVEVEAGREDLLAEVEARVLDPDGEARDIPLLRVDETRLEARFPLPGEGVYRPVLRLGGDRFLRVPAVTLPYSPEFEPRMDPAAGETLLRRIADLTGGRVDPPAGDLLAGPRTSRGATPIAPVLAWIALGLFLLEIAVRRLQLRFPDLRLGVLGRLLGRNRLPRLRRRVSKPAAATPPPAPEPAEARAEPAAEVPTAEREPSDIASVLDRARARRKRR